MNHGKGEKQYQAWIADLQQRGATPLGLMTSYAFEDDPKRLAFTFARYKFVAKMLAGCRHVLEAGCGDAFATRIVVQAVDALTAVDFDPAFVEDANARMSGRWRFECRVHDMLAGPVAGEFDGAYSLDVLEHIPADREHVFLRNLVAPLTAHAPVVIGMPSLQSQAYASTQSREGHVNCKDQEQLKALLQRYFQNVFMFGMNDEVVHTGFGAMAHYHLALCCGKKTA